MPQISYLVRSQVRARLADPKTGFNFWLAQACLSEPTELPLEPFVIDFSDRSPTFWQSYISADDLDATTSSSDGTLCILYSARSSTPGATYQKFSTFGGPVHICIDFEIAWGESFDPSDTESLADATEDAMVQTFNSSAYFSNFNSGVLWNGVIDCVRSPMRQGGPGWRQRLSFALLFELETA
jgi:hypothetical protein